MSFFDQERARAKALNYPDPTNPTYEATTEMYHNTLSECLSRVKKLKERGDMANKVSIMVATHNEDTVRFALGKYVFPSFKVKFCSSNIEQNFVSSRIKNKAEIKSLDK